MRPELLHFLILLLLNLVIVSIYLAVSGLCAAHRSEKMRKTVWFNALVMLLCPVVGICFFAFSYVLERTLFRQPVDLEDVIFSKKRVKTWQYADEEQERNVVPVEDAIEISDTESQRQLMLHIVRRDIRDSLAAISLALGSEDSETSHYAAAVLQDTLDQFRSSVQKMHHMIEENPKEQTEDAGMLIDDMNPVLKQKVFTPLEQEAMVHMMDEVGEILFENQRNDMTSGQFEALSMRLLEAGDYENCRKWCERADYLFPEELATYTCQLKLYFTLGEKGPFFRVLKELKESNIVIDNETLELIRTFS